jgi:hypothetical protein
MTAVAEGGAASRLGDFVATYDYRETQHWFDADGTARQTVRNGTYQVRSRGEWIVIQIQYELPVTLPDGSPDLTEFNYAWVFRDKQLRAVVEGSVWFDVPLAGNPDKLPAIIPFDLTDGWGYRWLDSGAGIQLLDRVEVEARRSELYGASARTAADRVFFESAPESSLPTPFGTGRLVTEERYSPAGNTLAQVFRYVEVPQSGAAPLRVPRMEKQVTRFLGDFPADVTIKQWSFERALPGLAIASEDTEAVRDLLARRRDEAILSHVELQLVNYRRSDADDVVSMRDWQAIVEMVVPAGHGLESGVRTRSYPADGSTPVQLLAVDPGESGWIAAATAP